MIALLWKDFRVNRTILLGNIISVMAIYLTVAIALGTSRRRVSHTEWLDAIAAAAVACICLTCGLAAAYGGTAFAQERRERSANFLAMLPVRRAPIIISKLVVSAASVVAMILINVIVLFNCVVFVIGRSKSPDNPLTQDWTDICKAILVGAAVTLMLFGVGWFLSTMLQSASIAALVSIATTIAVNLLIILIIGRTYVQPATQNNLNQIFCMAISGAIGIFGLLHGTIYYLRRIEP